MTAAWLDKAMELAWNAVHTTCAEVRDKNMCDLRAYLSQRPVPAGDVAAGLLKIPTSDEYLDTVYGAASDHWKEGWEACREYVMASAAPQPGNAQQEKADEELGLYDFDKKREV